MKFEPLPLKGAFLIRLEKREDERGFFARYFCKNEFEQAGINFNSVQMNTTLTLQKGTVRGMHFQRAPKLEAKIVRCFRGAIFDAIVDLRAGSPTFGISASVELNEDNKNMLYIPEGFAHGFQTLTDNCELLYMHSEFYSPADEGGVRFDDPALQINWPLPVAFVSERDQSHPLLSQVIPL
jgi:dTDP-4-dehydrorhamnose 3,5-epimerase